MSETTEYFHDGASAEKKVLPPNTPFENDANLEGQMLNDLRLLLKTTEGRRIFWMLLSRCKVFESIMETNAKIYYRAGQQDMGHFLMAQIIKADHNSFSTMLNESQKGVMIYE